MLLDRASALTGKISAYQALKNTSDQTDQFATRALQFSNVSKLLAHLRLALVSLSDAGVPVDFKPNDGSSFAAKACLLRQEIKANPAKISDPPFDLKYGFSDRLTAIAVAGEKAGQLAWKGFVDKRAAFGADDVLNALALVPQFKVSVSRIIKIRSEVAAIGAALPSDVKTTIEKIDALLAQHETEWTTLDASDIPTSVVAFIRAAASGGAMLSSFTPEVRLWLDGHNLLNVFRIKIG